MNASVSLKALRAHAVRRTLGQPTDLATAIDALGFVQLDPIRAPARAADLILRHRVDGYRVGDLDRAYPQLPLAEDYVHVYGVLPARAQEMLHPRSSDSWHVEREHPRMAARILAHVRANGVTHPRDLQETLGKVSIVNGWGGSSAATTRMLEVLQYRGKLRVARREGGIKLYDLSVPRARTRPRSAATRAREIFMLLLRLYAPLPEPCLRRLARMATDGLVAEDVRVAILAKMCKDGAIRRIEAAGTTFLMTADEQILGETEDRVRLLAPFDPVVWDRRRFELFWKWDYRFEAYTPPGKRRFGYYALPLLWRDDVIGWANATMVNGTLQVTAGFAKTHPRGIAFRRALEAEVAALATSIGAADIAIASGMNVSVPILFLIPTLIWGSTWLAITFQLGTVAPEVSVCYRFALAATMMAAWCLFTGRSLRFSLRNHAYLAGLGVLMMGFNYIWIYRAEQHVTSGLVAVLFSTLVFMSPIAMRLAFGTPLRAMTFIAAIFGVTGVALLFVPELSIAQQGGAVALGVGLTLAATASCAIGNLVAVRNHRAGMPTLPATAWGLGYGSLLAAAVVVTQGMPWTFDPRLPYILSLAYLALFGSVIAFGVYFTLLNRVGAGPASYTTVATPIIAMLMSTLFEGYRWTGTAGLGVLLAVFGVWLSLRQPAATGRSKTTTPA